MDDVCANSSMSDLKLIRFENLRALNKKATELALDMGSHYTYWRDMLAGKKPSFGERVARKVEETYGLPAGCMDIPGGVGHGGVTPTHKAAEQAPPFHVRKPAEPTENTGITLDADLSRRAIMLAMLFDEVPDGPAKDKLYTKIQRDINTAKPLDPPEPSIEPDSPPDPTPSPRTSRQAA